MQSLSLPRRDPAPSRVAYRLHRLWLTPVFRALLRVGAPAFAMTFLAGAYLADDARRAAITESLAEMRRAVQERPEFMVHLVAIDGATPDVDAAIRQTLGLTLPISSFDVDLEAARQRILLLDPVDDVDLQVRGGGTLHVAVTERVPAVVWRDETGLVLLDATGRRVRQVNSRLDRADLPLIAGTDAAMAVPEALGLLAAAGPISKRIRGLVRMGGRRWDIVLDRNQRILLPETEAIRALERVIALDQAQGLLARDITAVDMRNERRPTLRLTSDSMGELRRIRGYEVGVTNQ